MKLFSLLLLLALSIGINAQQNRIKAGAFGIPAASGFGLASIGYERLNKKQAESWQLHLNFSGGSIGNDAPVTSRKWLSVEKTFYVKNKIDKRHFFYSFFTELGNRIVTPGFSHPPPDSILQKTKSFEISPGIVIGAQYQIKKKFGFQFYTGPKIIFAHSKEEYYNSIMKVDYFVKFSDVKAGFRFMGTISYQF